MRLMCLLNLAFLTAAAFLPAACGRVGNLRPEDQHADTSDAKPDSASADSTHASLPDSLTFALVGDIMMGTTEPREYLPADNGRNLFDDVKPILRRVDVAAGNLEGALFDGAAESKPLGPDSYAFRTPARYVANLVDAGFDFLGVANNHASDFGQTGRRATQSNLREAGIAYAGIRHECETAVIERHGLKIGLTQFAHSGNTLSILDYEEVRRVVGALNDSCDLVVVGFHGGAEGKGCSRVPHADETAFGERRGNVEKFARTAVDAGADIVYGHGPHVPRAAELYKDRIIFYSLGNFCTPFRMSLSGISGYAPVSVVSVDGEGRFLSGRIHSFVQKPGLGPRADSSGSVASFIRTLSYSDFPESPLVISPDGSLSGKRIEATSGNAD